MGTENHEGLDDINIGNFIEVEIPVKSELVLGNGEYIKTGNNENDSCVETSLECAQVDLMTDTQVELQNSSEPMVGAFYEVNYKSEEMEYVSHESGTVYESDCSFVNGDNIVFTSAQAMGDGCVLQIVDPKIFEGLNGKHTIRCADGTEIQVDIVHQEEVQNDNLRDNNNFKIVLPNNSSVVKTYPPSNKVSAALPPPVNSNTQVAVVTKEESLQKFFQETKVEPEILDIKLKLDPAMKVKPEPNLLDKSLKCKGTQKSCLKCKKVFSKPHQLVWHCETMCGKKPFRCYTCNKRFSKEKFNYHVLLCREKAKVIPEMSSDSDS